MNSMKAKKSKISIESNDSLSNSDMSIYHIESEELGS